MNRSALRGYKDAGIQKVQWWVAKDERTCDICGVNHEKIYDVDKAPILPCHPGCRCTWLPVADDVSKLGSGKSSGQKDSSNGEYVETIHDMKSVDKYIKKYENIIESLPIEHSYIIQRDGKVFHFIGSEKSVSFEGVDINGAIIMHNHPHIEGEDTNSFEDDDFRFLQNYGLIINRLRATYDNARYEVKVLKDLSQINYDSYKYGEIGTSLQFGEITGNLHELIFKKMDEEGLIKYVKLEKDK